MINMRRISTTLAAGVAAALLLAGCAQVPEGAGSDPKDPWEKFNRSSFAFNQKIDSYVLRPIAKGYQWAVPEAMRDSIGNVFVNLSEPANILNNSLQGKGEGALVSLCRLMINSTLGVGGLLMWQARQPISPKELKISDRPWLFGASAMVRIL